MSDEPGPAPTAGEGLSIGQLVERTGIKATTLRAWELRHDFPTPLRRASGHRRYSEQVVADILEVRRLREGGSRLESAIAHVATRSRQEPRSGGSIFAELRRAHPDLLPVRLRKSTLLALTWAMEDEILARGGRAHVFGAFQRARFFEAAEARWRELDRVSTSTYVFADFDSTADEGPRRVPLREDSPVRREWAVVCDGADLPCLVVAWELPGQRDKPDPQRVFEGIITLDPHAVRTAARVCAAIADEAGDENAGDVREELRSAPSSSISGTSVTNLFTRVIAYIDSPPQ